MSTPYSLSVCAEMVYTDLPLIERVERIHAAGFGVEIWDWSTKDNDALVATGARFTSIAFPPAAAIALPPPTVAVQRSRR